MADTHLIAAVLSVFMGHAPLFLTYLIGIAFALLKWGQHPRAAVLVLIGCSVLMLNGIVLGAVGAILPHILIQRGWQGADFGGVFIVLNLLRSVISSIGIACLLFAAFSRRPQFED